MFRIRNLFALVCSDKHISDDGLPWLHVSDGNGVHLIPILMTSQMNSIIYLKRGNILSTAEDSDRSKQVLQCRIDGSTGDEKS